MPEPRLRQQQAQPQQEERQEPPQVTSSPPAPPTRTTARDGGAAADDGADAREGTASDAADFAMHVSPPGAELQPASQAAAGQPPAGGARSYVPTPLRQLQNMAAAYGEAAKSKSYKPARKSRCDKENTPPAGGALKSTYV